MTGRHVLVVEDSPANLLLVETVLKRAGYRVTSVYTAEDALEQLRIARPDLVLTDVQLPGRDGLDLARQIRADPALTGIAIVALTAYAMAEDRERALAAGCDGYIAKPVNTRTLVDELSAILGARRPPPDRSPHG